MKLYYSRGACSLAPHIVLHELGIQFTAVAVDLKTKKTAAGDDYLKINPKGYVPALQLEEGEVLTEAAVVLQYLADQKPASGLIAAAGTLERYRVLEWLHFISTEIHKNFSPFFAPNTPDAYKDTLRNRLQQRLRYVDQMLTGRDYLCGSQFTIADAYLFTVLNWTAAVALTLQSLPALAAYQKRIAARPAVQAAIKAEG